MEPIPVEIPAVDGYVLRGRVWYPDALPATGLVLIHPATAVPERLYFAFARYVTERGLMALTYSYRGIDGSRPASLRGFRASMRDWADLDVEGVTAWAGQCFPKQPLYAVGHSFGGHALGLCESTAALRAAVQVASHAGTMRIVTDRAERWRITLLLHWVAPPLTRLFGYLPGARLGIGEDLPAGVLLEWSRWTRLTHYFFDDPTLHAAERFARVRTPILSFGFDDDPWATPAGIAMLLAHLVNASVEQRAIDATRRGAASIGHMGYFRKPGAFLWPETIDWLLAAGAQTPSMATPAAHGQPDLQPLELR